MMKYIAAITTFAICSVWLLIIGFTIPVFMDANAWKVLSWTWYPDSGFYGILPMLCGTILLSFSATLIAWPLSIGVACYIEVKKSTASGLFITKLVQFMTTIPTVVYGFASIFLLVPLVREGFAGSGLCWFSAMFVLAFLILPTMIMLIQTAINQVWSKMGMSMTALGFSSMEQIICLVIPLCKGWLISAIVLGLGRAMGDTLIALMLSGNAPIVPSSLFSSMRALSAHITLVTATEAGGIAYNSLFMAASWLLLLSIVTSLTLRRIAHSTATTLVLAKPCLLPAWSIKILQKLCMLISFFVAFCVLSLLAFLLYKGLGAINLNLFFGNTPIVDAILGKSRVWEGIWPAFVGTISLLILTMMIAIIPGICSGIYLAEYATGYAKAGFSLLVDMLAGIPSIVMGFFGILLIILLRHTFWTNADSGLFLSALCLALLVLPVLIVSTRNALESQPQSLRVTGFSLGLSQAQIIRKLLLPQASNGIWSGLMLAMGRAAEDTAVIILTGAVINAGLPSGFGQRFEALPFLIYYRAAQYQDSAELSQGFGAAIVLLCLVSSLLIFAYSLQRHYTRNYAYGGNYEKP